MNQPEVLIRNEHVKHEKQTIASN